MPVDHVAIYVPSDKYEQVVDCYKKILKPLNYEVGLDLGKVVGLGYPVDGAPLKMDFWIAPTDGPTANTHIAFSAKGMINGVSLKMTRKSTR